MAAPRGGGGARADFLPGARAGGVGGATARRAARGAVFAAGRGFGARLGADRRASGSQLGPRGRRQGRARRAATCARVGGRLRERLAALPGAPPLRP